MSNNRPPNSRHPLPSVFTHIRSATWQKIKSESGIVAYGGRSRINSDVAQITIEVDRGVPIGWVSFGNGDSRPLTPNASRFALGFAARGAR